MQHAFKAQECYFFLLGPFSDLIDNHLPAKTARGTRLQITPITPECSWQVTIEVDSQGTLASMTVQDVRTPDISHWHWDFIAGTFNNCGDELDLICGHPTFHLFQQIIPSHYSADNLSVTTTAL